MSESNDPRILVEFKRHEASWLMDILHDEWNRRVMQFALISDGKNRYDSHVLEWYKRRATMFLRRFDDRAYEQGFWENGVGL